MQRMLSSSIDRRGFLGVAAGLAGSSLLGSSPLTRRWASAAPTFEISLAEWSLHRTLRRGDLTNLQFPQKARSMGISAVEYVNSFFKAKAKDDKYLAELKRRCDGL